jgi:hypothetical protein
VDRVKGVLGRSRIKEDRIVYPSKVPGALLRIAVGILTLPNDLVLKVLFAENLIEHHFHIMAGVPVTMKI